MNKGIMIWSGVVMLLILIAAGWFGYTSMVTKSKFHISDSPQIEPLLHAESKITGTVIEYGGNPDEDIDKMLLAASGEKVWLHFPPHTAKSIMAEAPINSLVEVTAGNNGPGGHRPNPVLELKYLRKQSSATGINLAEFPAPHPKKGYEVEIKGRQNDFKGDSDQGRNFILSGNLISLPPHMARELLPLIGRANLILVKGNLRDSTEGFLSASGVPVVKARSIQLDSIIYKIR